MKRIAIFAGHSGKDSGAINGTGPGDTLYSVESEITRCIASKVCFFFKLLGVEYALSYGSFEQRIRQTRGCDAGISIHCDVVSTQTVHGYHVIHYPGSAGGLVLAHDIDDALYKLTDRSRKPHSKNLYILRETAFPTVLIEYGFLSNAQDEAALHDEEYQYNLAFNTVQGVRNWMYK